MITPTAPTTLATTVPVSGTQEVIVQPVQPWFADFGDFGPDPAYPGDGWTGGRMERAPDGDLRLTFTTLSNSHGALYVQNATRGTGLTPLSGTTMTFSRADYLRGDDVWVGFYANGQFVSMRYFTAP